MTLPISGIQGGGVQASRQIGLDVAGEGSVVPGRANLASGGPSFADTLEGAINQVSQSQDVATDYIERFVRGEPVELHQVMAATEEAGIALTTLISIRDKITDAYKTIVNMQG